MGAGSPTRTREAVRRGDAAALVRYARDARARVDALSDDAVADILRELLAARGDLVDRVSSPRTPFDIAHRSALLREVDEAIGGFGARAEAAFGTRAPELAAVVREIGARELSAAGVALPFDVRIPVDAIVVAQSKMVGEMIVDVSDHFRAQVRADLSRSLAGGMDLRDFLQRTAATLNSPGPFGTAGTRAEVILRTEFGRTVEVARDVQRDALSAAGLTYRKKWISTMDARTRPDHLALNGVEVGEDEDFDVGGEPGAYPLDPRLSPEQSINCRCTVVHLIEPPEESPDGHAHRQ